MSDILDKDDKWIFLFSFCQAWNIQKVKEFIEYYPYFKIDSFNESTWYNPLLISVAEWHEEIVQYLLLKWANPNVYTIANNASSLWIASQYGFLSIIKIFVFYWANINIKDDEWSTPLFRAAKFWHEEIVQYLLANWADPNLLSNDGSSAYDWAKSRNEGEIMRILRQASKSSLPY
jgi:ankyrin repeat protein